jgi:transcriptional regulator with XRE-family HTH domain
MTTQQLHDNRLRIGQRIIDLRKEQGLSQNQLAQKAGIEQATISRLEKGAFSVGVDVLAKVLEALGASVEIIPRTR